MQWINYHHLLYFWMVVREGSIARACERLHLAQPTVSAQLHALEKSLGEKLFQKVGRRLELTDSGRLVYRYADEIFSLGKEMADALRGRPTGRPLRLYVGVADALPKLVVYRLLEPAFHLAEPIRITCLEGKPERLLAELSTHSIDLVLSDAPIHPSIKVRAFNHLLGECGLGIFGSQDLAERYRTGFPTSLDGAPFLLPTEGSTLRRSLDQWFEQNDIRPDIRGEFEDSALMKVFAEAGDGLFASPLVIEAELHRQYAFKAVGTVESIRERFYAISVERKLKHPAVVAISESARRTLFA